MNIAAILQERARQHPDRPAIIEGPAARSRITSFAALDAAAARGAALLRAAGLRPGDAVLVFQPMSAELYAALTAIFRLGLVAMFIDPGAGRDHLQRCCAIRPPRALIASHRAHLLRLVAPDLRRIPLKFSIGWPVPGAVPWSAAGRLPPDHRIEPAAADTPALLTFTSGSTGEPKAAVRTHGFLRAQHRVLARALALQPGQVDLTTLPIFLLANLASGVTSVIPAADLRRPGRIDPAPVAAQIRAHGVQTAGGSPALLLRLAAHCEAQGMALDGLRRVLAGGAPVFPRHLAAFQRMAPRAEVAAVYGSTEAEPIAEVAWAEMRPEDLAAMRSGAGLLVGAPVPEIELRILPDRWGTPIGPFDATGFAAACLPPGEPGEIVVTGPHVLPGYLDGRGDAESKFRVEGTVWHRTGDAGYLDAEGRLWLLGRCGARITDARGTLYPFAVECAAMDLPAVRRAAVVAHRGRRVLVVEGEATPAGLQAALAWAHLDEVRPVRRIPVDRRHNAKVDYPALHRLLGRY